jgi:DNA polymerase elongation subunit (family B)
LFVLSNNSEVKTIFGQPVVKKKFESYQDYSTFQEEQHGNINIFENNLRPEIQFLAETYNGIPDEEIIVPNLLIYFIDIEVLSNEGFPDYKNSNDPIILISILNNKTNKTITFGYDPFSNRDYTGKEKIEYIKCNSEDELLIKFMSFMHSHPCDVLSGYNIWSFDLPYIISRCKVLFGEKRGKEIYESMSPVNVVNVWKQKKTNDDNIDIAGMTILDYYDVYKKYGKKLEKYTLDYVSKNVLELGKKDTSNKSLYDFAKDDWNGHIEYNVIDCKRVYDLENKLGFIRLIQALSLLSKAPMKYYNAMTQLIEGAMITYYRRNKLCAPHFFGGNQETFEAAYVKEPDIGLHEWVVDIDITSSYPSHIITLNMSNETFFGKISGLTEEQVVYYARKREFEDFILLKDEKGVWTTRKISDQKLITFNNALKKGLLSVAPCGSVFNTTKIGVVSQVEKNVFFKRKEVNRLKKQIEMEANKLPTSIEKKNKLDRVSELDSLQWALKIFLNAFFGIMAVPYSRYFNIHIAEAITSGGRHTIKQGQKFCNEILNNPPEDLINVVREFSDKELKQTSLDLVHYSDTDSLFVGLGKWFIEKGICDDWNKIADDENKIKLIKKISHIMEKYIDNRIFNEVQLIDYNSQVHDFKISFKQEIIAKTFLAVKKKKYAYWLVNKDGIPKNEICVTGLEIVRSDSAEAIRPRLKMIMEMIMKQMPETGISNTIRKYKKELKQLPPEDLAANIGINNIRKYLSGDKPKKGTPWHVKGVFNYNILLNHLKLKDKYETIHEGLKAKVVYVKKNPFNIDTITFHTWPDEFNGVLQYDAETMIDKFFIQKIKFLLDPIGKSHLIEDSNKINLFF